MEIRLAERGAFCVCGYAVETTLAQNDADIAALYRDFFENGGKAALEPNKGRETGYYGVSWYMQDHEKYCYLLGIAAGSDTAVSENAVLKRIPATLYAVAGFPGIENIIDAWSDFFYREIPQAGLRIDKRLNVYFEYYPGLVDEDYELWVPVVKVKAE